MSTRWKRSDSVRLGEEALRCGIDDYEEAATALHVGARLLAHGFTNADIDRAVLSLYRSAARAEQETR
jgi:hypothetical protein